MCLFPRRVPGKFAHREALPVPGHPSRLTCMLSLLLIAVKGHSSYRSSLPNAFSTQYGQQQSNNVGHTGNFRFLVRDAGYSWTHELCQADSDGDGQSNGLEMGDPCCTWAQGTVAAYTDALSYPGSSSSTTSRLMPNCGGTPASPAPPPPSPPPPPRHTHTYTHTHFAHLPRVRTAHTHHPHAHWTKPPGRLHARVCTCMRARVHDYFCAHLSHRSEHIV